jgi:hypothetical protein
MLNIIIPDKIISDSERRSLEKFPSLTIDTLFSGEFFTKLEKYELDQMVFREKFRTVKAITEFSVFNKKDNNNIFIKNDYVFKMEYPYNQNYVYNMSEKMNEIYDTYLKGMSVYYSIIPDKNYFIKDNDKHLFIDYDDMISILNTEVKNMEYIDIFSCLSIGDYYKTDIHWKQENLGKVVDALGEKMNFTNSFDDSLYEKKLFSPFYGAYYGQAALPVKPDILTYMTNDSIEGAIVKNYEDSGDDRSSQKVYSTEKLSGVDSYDVFLSGATPFIQVENPKNNSGKELIIFRDSFASSLTPLLIQEYSKITLIDLRYVNSAMLGELVDFGKQDVLFLYSTSLVNNSNILK